MRSIESGCGAITSGRCANVTASLQEATMSDAIEWSNWDDHRARRGLRCVLISRDPLAPPETPYRLTRYIDPDMERARVDPTVIPYTVVDYKTHHATIDEAKAAAEQWLHQQED